MAQLSVFSGLIERAAAAIDAGLNVVVTGHPGAGLYAVADDVVARLSEDRRVVFIRGVKAWQQIPFSALSSTRADVAAVGAGNQPAPTHLRAAVEELSQELGPTGVIVVTHPEWADLVTIGAITLTSGQFGHPVIVVADSLSVAATRVSLLHSLRPGLTLSVPPLTFDQVLELARSRLGGPVDIETAARIHVSSGGLYAVAQGIIDVGHNSGTIVQVGGLWKAIRIIVDDEVGAFAKYLIGGLNEPQLAFLHAIAAASIGGEPLEAEANPVEELAVLSEAGFVVEEAGRLMVFPPVLENVMRSSEGLLRRGRAAQLIAAGHLGDHAPVFGVGPAQDDAPGWIADAPEGTATILSQRIRGDLRTAATRLRTAWASTRAAADALPLLIALLGSGVEREAIESVVVRTHADVDSRDYALLRLWWATYLTLTLNRAEEGLSELAADTERLPRYRPLFEAAEQHLRMSRGEPVPADDELADDPDVDFGLGRVARVDAMLFRGDTADAARLAADHEGVLPVFAAQLDLSGNIAMMLDGHIEEALEQASAALEFAERRRNLGLMQVYAYNVMFGLFLRGRLAEARALLDRMMTISTSRALHAPYQLGMIDIGVLLETLSGNVKAARRIADVVAELPQAIGPLPGMGATTSRTQLGVGWPPERVREIVMARIASRQLVSACFMAVVAMRDKPDARITAELSAATATAQSPVLRLIGDYLAAESAGDTTGLLDVAEHFQGLDSVLMVVAARARAASQKFSAGDRDGAFALAHSTWDESESLGAARRGLFAPLSNRIGLSHREVDVIRAGAGGLVNRDIAETLGLSPRTVEGHLHSVYLKAGTRDRAELSRACTTWLRAAADAEPDPE